MTAAALRRGPVGVRPAEGTPGPPRAWRRGRGRGLGLATRRKPGDLRDGGNKRAAGRGRGWAVTAAAPRPGRGVGSYGAGRGACGWMKGRPCRVPRAMGPPFEGLGAEIPVPELAVAVGAGQVTPRFSLRVPS